MSRPKRPEHAVTREFEVGFHQCDPLAVVWHGRYFEWFEQTRAGLFSSVDLDVPEIRALGFRMFVTEAKCRYMVPLEYGDSARVTAWFSELTPLIRVAYDVYNPRTERWSARSTTVLATTDATGVLLPKTPDAILDRLPTL